MPAMPDITKAQVVAFVGVLAVVLNVLFKLNLTDEQQAVIVTAIVSLWALAHLISDAIIRHGRSKIGAAKVTADGQTARFAAFATADGQLEQADNPPAEPAHEDILAIEGVEPAEDHSGHPHGSEVATDA